MPRTGFKALLKRLDDTARRKLAPEQIQTRNQCIEIVLIPAIAIGLAWLASPQDPMLLQTLFPWLWLAPVLIALRYGVMPGLLACVPLLANWLVADRLHLIGEGFTLEYLFGGGLLVLLCGEFSDVWSDRIVRMDETNVYLTERLSRLTKRHLLLNLSHDRLEQEMLTRPNSLRDALARLRTMASAEGQVGRPMPGATELLHLLSQYVNVESAALYSLVPRGEEMVLGEEIMRLGEPEALQPDDELLKLALEQHHLAHIASKDLAQNRRTNQLVVAPLVAGSDELIGVLAVTRMPFFSLHIENLQMMSVILSYYADNLRNATLVRTIQERIAGVPIQYAEELAIMRLLQHKVGIPSQILLMTFTGELSHVIPAEFLRVKRGLDLYWQLTIAGQPAIAILMPFASSAALEGFMLRIEGWLAHRFNGTFDSLGVHLRTIDFTQGDPLEALALAIQG
jgi:polysaccharide biosynthesis protein PelD